MAKPTLSERMSAVETHIEHIKADVSEIKYALLKHVEWEETKYANLEKSFATKERVDIMSSNLEALDKEISDLPNNLDKKYAGIWTEGYIKGILFTIGGSAAIAVFIHFIYG